MMASMRYAHHAISSLVTFFFFMGNCCRLRNNHVKNHISVTAFNAQFAFLECLLLAPEQYNYIDLYYIMEQLTALRPEVLQSLLENTDNIKVKRLFLYMAQKAGHYWFQTFDKSKIELGTAKRKLTANGIYIPEYKITIPKELYEYE